MLTVIQKLFNIQSVFYLVAIALALTVAICLIDCYRRPWLIHWRAYRIIHRAKIRNKLKEYATLKRVYKKKLDDKGRELLKDHELLLEFDSRGLGLDDFNTYIDRWTVGLNGMIRMDYGDKANRICLYYLPRKYVRPTLITPKDNAIGSIGVQHLINLLIVGPTGTGKTVATKIILEKIVKFQTNVKIWLLDFKQFDFKAFAGLPRYYGYKDCIQGLDDYYEEFKRAQQTGSVGVPHYLVIDEWASFISSVPRKEAERLTERLAELLMLGRAYQFIPIVGLQRADSLYFGTARDNIQNVIALGNLSREGQRMIFPDSVKGQITDCKKREGHLYIDGKGLEKIRIADISDMGALDDSIRKAMSRQN